jgi:RimJ/RimL family protein N-acetyltransferase
MNVIIETERLILRTFTIEDAPLIYNLNLDPEVVRYTLDPHPGYRTCPGSIGKKRFCPSMLYITMVDGPYLQNQVRNLLAGAV